MKKALVLLLTLAMLATMVVGVSAASVTIQNAVVDQTYTAYKMLDYTTNGSGYVYSPASGWSNFFNNDTTAQQYYVVTTSGGIEYVTMVDGKIADQTIAKAALAYAKTAANNITATATATASVPAGATEATAAFADLPAGYYVIDTTLGTLLALTHDDSNTYVTEKNSIPGVDKFVSDTATVGTSKESTAAIGDKAYYKIEVTVGAGAEGYSVTDTLSAGLTFDNNVVITGATIEEDYTLAVNGQTFVIDFEDTYLAGLTADTKIVITFSATVNKDAVIRGNNKNTVRLDYNNGYETDEVNTVVVDASYTKVSVNGTQKNPLAGAEFKLYDALTGGNEIKVVKLTATAAETAAGYDGVYRLAVAGETGVNLVGTKVLIKGLKVDANYYIEEVVVPAGYNKLNARAKLDADETATVNTEVENKSGSEFPETGGAGTVAFTVVGSLLMLAAVVLFTAKKKMSVQG